VSDPLDVFMGIGRTERKERKKAFPGKLPPKNREEKEREDILDTLPYREYLVDGVAVPFYTIGSLAKALGRSPVTIRSWEAKHWLPAPAFRTPPPTGHQLPGKSSQGSRLYSRDQMRFLIDAFYMFRIDDPRLHDWPGFKQHIQDNYPRK
jgi:hypothetical protein